MNKNRIPNSGNNSKPNSTPIDRRGYAPQNERYKPSEGQTTSQTPKAPKGGTGKSGEWLGIL